MLSVPDMKLTSSFLFSSDQHEHALHLLVSPVSWQQVFPAQLVFEMIYNPLDVVYTVVRPAFFVILHLQDPSLQCFQLNRSQSVCLMGRKACRHQNFQSLRILCDRILMVISLVFDTDLSQYSCRAHLFEAVDLSQDFCPTQFCEVRIVRLGYFRILNCGRCRFSVSVTPPWVSYSNPEWAEIGQVM